MDKHAYVCFDVRIAVSDPREVSPTAHQSLNIAVLYAVLHSFFKKSIDPWNARQDMDVSVRKLNKLFLCGLGTNSNWSSQDPILEIYMYIYIRNFDKDVNNTEIK